MNKIIFVDDDRYFASLYIEYLQSEFDVKVAYEAEAAVRLIDTENDICAIILDMMMPPPPGKSHETLDGVTTGLWILDQIRHKVIEQRIPVMIFSNRGTAFIDSELAFIGLDRDICSIREKPSVDADSLPTVITTLISRR